jgi:hypothetical protein
MTGGAPCGAKRSLPGARMLATTGLEREPASGPA